MTDLNGQKAYEFGEFRVIPREGLLLRNGEPIPMTPKVFETLVFLLDRRGTLVRKAELMDQVWADSFVEENAVSKSVWSIRNALGEDPKHPRYIQTVPKRGYRFVGEVLEMTGEVVTPVLLPADAPPLLMPEQAASPLPERSRDRSRILAVSAVALATLLLGLYATRGRFLTSDNVGIRTMTVIPFRNVSGDHEEEYFVNGVTDTLIADLSRINALKIIALPADLRGQDEPSDLNEIQRRLNVDAIVTGSVSRSGDRARVAVQLIHVPSGRNLWSRTYERELRDVQRLHKEITRNVVEELRLTLSPQDAERLSRTLSIVPEAYDQYLRGRFFLNTQNPEDQDTAIAALEQAVQIDPSFGTAYAELAQAYTWKQFAFAPEQKDLTEKAFIAVQKALALDSDAAPAYLARGRLLWTPENKFPHEKAISDYRRAIELDPNLDEARNQLALVYCHIGLLDEALAQAREGVKINPTNNLLLLRIGQTLNSQMKFEDALAVLNSIPIKVHPSVIGHQTAWALFNLGRKKEAAEKVEQLSEEYPDKGGTFAAMKAVIEASQGNNTEAERLIAEAIEKGKGFGHFHHTAYTIACAYALMNKRDEAIYWLERAAETGFPCYPSFEKEASLNTLRNDPRFQAFLLKNKERWDNFKAMR